MKKPVKINIPSPYAADTILHDRCPAFVQYKLAYASCNYWQHAQFSIVEQFYDGKDAFFCLVELNTHIPLSIPIYCNCHDLYWVYQLAGSYSVTDIQEHHLLFDLKAGYYTFIELPPGAYITHFGVGRHLLGYHVLRYDWLERSDFDGLGMLKSYLHDRHTQN